MVKTAEPSAPSAVLMHQSLVMVLLCLSRVVKLWGRVLSARVLECIFSTKSKYPYSDLGTANISNSL